MVGTDTAKMYSLRCSDMSFRLVQESNTSQINGLLVCLCISPTCTNTHTHMRFTPTHTHTQIHTPHHIFVTRTPMLTRTHMLKGTCVMRSACNRCRLLATRATALRVAGRRLANGA